MSSCKEYLKQLATFETSSLLVLNIKPHKTIPLL